MILDRTVLVIGAGASVEYLFPTGWGLVRDVEKELTQDRSGRRSILSSGYDGHQLTDFVSELYYSGARSVDEFLETREDLVELGKLAIAAALIPREVPEVIHARGAERPTWLQLLVSRLAAPTAEEWKKNRLSIVTFNYDRVLEYFLHQAVRYRYGLETNKAAELVRSTIKIIHVHGQLGAYPGIGDGWSRDFKSTAISSELRNAAEAIRIVHEGDLGDPKFVQARELISDAGRVVFLGFGFGEANVRKLDLANTVAGKHAWASAIGLKDFEREEIRATISLNFGQAAENLTDFIRCNPVLAARRP